MKLVSKVFALTTLVVACSAAHAVDSANLTIKGTITPGSCTPTLTVSEFAYNNITGLEQSSPKLLPELTSGLTVTCGAAVKVGFKVVDEHNGTSPWTTVDVAAGAGLSAFGLGYASDGTTKIGGYAIALDNLQVTDAADASAAGQVFSSLDGKTGWTAKAGVAGLDTTNTFAIEKPSDTTGPAAYKTYTGNLRVQAQIDSKDNLGSALRSDVLLNGQATINMVYL